MSMLSEDVGAAVGTSTELTSLVGVGALLLGDGVGALLLGEKVGSRVGE